MTLIDEKTMLEGVAGADGPDPGPMVPDSVIDALVARVRAEGLELDEEVVGAGVGRGVD
jgi:hypothetical protein